MLAQHPAMAEIAAFGVADACDGEIRAAALRLRYVVPSIELAAFRAARVARFKIPATWYRAAA